MNLHNSGLEDPLARFGLIDEAMPVMLAYIDAAQRYRYHNRAFREWIGLESAQIDGHTMREVLGETVYGEIAQRVAEAISGQAMRYERTHKARGGGAQRLFIHLVPHRGDNGEVAGIFALIVDQARNGLAAARTEAPKEAPPAPGIGEAQLLYDASLDMDLTGWHNAADRIRSALKNDELILYAQPIRDLRNDAAPRFYEICLRMAEEEENRMPPGAFLPLAEKYGLMSDLDRWTVTHVLKTLAARRHASPRWLTGACCVPLSRDSIADPYFADFVQGELATCGIPGEALRFELQASDVSANPADAAHLVQELARAGCHCVLSGFGRGKIDFDILKGLPVGFLRIDSSIVFRMLRDEAALGTLRAIARVARTVGIGTIAELVESEEQIARLREIGVDYAQGLAIGPPVPLKTIA